MWCRRSIRRKSSRARDAVARPSPRSMVTTPNAFIGSAIPRLEDERFLRGRGEYVGDLTRAGMLHAVLLRSPVAHGRLRTVDVIAARALPGVRAVFTASDIGPAIPIIPLRAQAIAATEPFKQPVI